MYNMLVEFIKYENRDIRSKVVDTQYHVFIDCCEKVAYINDSIYKAFSEKGYFHSAIDLPFSIDKAYELGFTVSDNDNEGWYI